MTIRVLVAGRLYGKPEARTGKNGNPFTTANLSIDTGEEHRTWASCIAFGREAERLAGLKDGDALSLAGRAKLEAYEAKDGAAGLALERG